MKKKLFVYTLIISLLLATGIGCTNQQESINTSVQAQSSSLSSSSTTSNIIDPQSLPQELKGELVESTPHSDSSLIASSSIPTQPYGNVLIVYYSFSGNTREAAKIIQEQTGGILYEIETVKTYPDVPKLYDIAKEELDNADYPELKNEIPDFLAYDLIIIGGPVWWYDTPSPLLAFLSQCDFKGKTVAPFATTGGVNGEYFDHLGMEAKNAKIIEGIWFTNADVGGNPSSIKEDIAAWLKNLDQV